MDAPLQRFGGDWTEEKLDRVGRYLRAYVVALKNQPFALEYVDAFAGTGYREMQASRDLSQPALEDLVAEDASHFRDGSARIALAVDPPFQRYVFIEKDVRRFAELQRLPREFPHLADRISVVNEEGNAYLQRYCQEMGASSGRRAVVFLDPYGMQVGWDTITAIAATRKIDLWYLFPLGVGVNRLLRLDGQLSEQWRRRLTYVLGTDEWETRFYQTGITQTLFGPEETTLKCGDFSAITEFLKERLAEIFAAVAPNPLALCNSRNNPLYLLCFAAGNPRGAALAVRIAGDILGRRRR